MKKLRINGLAAALVALLALLAAACGNSDGVTNQPDPFYSPMPSQVIPGGSSLPSGPPPSIELPPPAS